MLQNTTYSPTNSYLSKIIKPANSPKSATKNTTTIVSHNEPADNFQVVIRVRPPLPRELTNYKYDFKDIVQISRDSREITLSEYILSNSSEDSVSANHVFTFDRIFGPHDTQKLVYDSTAKRAIDSALNGYNATILAYGQTGSGKTYTMDGPCSNDEELHASIRNRETMGIISRSMHHVFEYISTLKNQSGKSDTKFLVRASYLQIYNDVISDLLDTSNKNLQIREDPKSGIFVEHLSEWVVKNPQEVYRLIEKGNDCRSTATTKMNDLSSRSHAVFRVIIEQGDVIDNETGEYSVKVGKLNLVDLAGSERVSVTGAEGARLEESKRINQSLSALGNVIKALTDKHNYRKHIPYRDSKLTRLLEDSLGGNCKTIMFCMISPASEAFGESLSTLKFANRAKYIQNNATVNEDVDQVTLIRRYENELKILRKELANRDRNVVDKRRLLSLEEERRRLEQDKLSAIRALEKQSHEFLLAKKEKILLENKIKKMSGMMIPAGQAIEETEHFQRAVAKTQNKFYREYKQKLAELENERLRIAEDKQQVDRYKQLLLKQRDIMVALTSKLSERDENIITLQDDMDRVTRDYDVLQDTVDQMRDKLLHCERLLVEYGVPYESDNEISNRPVDGISLLRESQEENRRLREDLEMLYTQRDSLQNVLEHGVESAIESSYINRLDNSWQNRDATVLQVQQQKLLKILTEGLPNYIDDLHYAYNRKNSDASYTFDIQNKVDRMKELLHMASSTIKNIPAVRDEHGHVDKFHNEQSMLSVDELIAMRKMELSGLNA